MAPLTTWSPDDVIISWTEPDNGGSPITSYTVYIRESNGVTFTTELSYCDGSDYVETRQCTIPVAVLRAEPFNLEWGASVFARVYATNFYGDSAVSPEGNGAVIQTYPDAPVNLAEDYSQRTKSTLGITWEDAAFTGGVEIIDYRISIAIQGQEFSVLASGVTDKFYTAVGLSFGTTYEFRVESRNSYDYSVFSDTLSLYCAFKPEPPLIITTTNVNDQVKLEWDLPVANGSPITGYEFYVQSTGAGAFV